MSAPVPAPAARRANNGQENFLERQALLLLYPGNVEATPLADLQRAVRHQLTLADMPRDCIAAPPISRMRGKKMVAPVDHAGQHGLEHAGGNGVDALKGLIEKQHLGP